MTTTAASIHDGSTVSITAEHLSITETYPSGGVHNVHLLSDPDLPVKLSRGDKDFGQRGETLVLIELDVNNEHDEVLVYSVEMEETLNRAREALEMAFTATRKVRKA